MAIACLAPTVAGQHAPAHGAPTNPGHAQAQQPAAHGSAEQKRGATTAPTHAPQPSLPPLLALQYVQKGNALASEARTHRRDYPAPSPRPSGAGRYVCAVLVCCDIDLPMHTLLGCRREDVLLLSLPGPFATPETLAGLERTLLAERVPLLLIASHADCQYLAKPAAGSSPDAITRRVDDVRADAERQRVSVPKCLVLRQREHLLASSQPLRDAVQQDTLRVFPVEVDAVTGALTFHHQRADALPIAPVK